MCEKPFFWGGGVVCVRETHWEVLLYVGVACSEGLLYVGETCSEGLTLM